MKIALISLVFLIGCNGKHLEWVSNHESPPETILPKLKENLNGVVFTFDDGPSLAYTPKVLEILKKHNLQATFFVEGINLIGDTQQCRERRELLKTISREGHIIGAHSYDHKDLTRLSQQQIIWQVDYTNKLIEDIIGKKVELIRLPYGRSNKTIRKILADRKMKEVNWDIDTREWLRDPVTKRLPTPELIFNSFSQQYNKLRFENGQTKIILLLHDSKSITAQSLPLILNYLQKENANK